VRIESHGLGPIDLGSFKALMVVYGIGKGMGVKSVGFCVVNAIALG
jgi:hypothetical protein